MILLALAHADCPAVDEALAAAESSLLQVRLEETDQALAQARQLNCDQPLERTVAARLHGLSGVLASMRNEDPTDAFRSAWMADSKVDLAAFGSSQRERLEAAGAAPVEPVPLRILPEPLAPREAWVDGRPARPTLFPGPHALQVTDPDGTQVFVSWLEVFPGEPVTLNTGLPPLEAKAPRKRLSVTLPSPFLLGGIGAGALGVATLAYSLERGAAMKRATTPKQLQSRWTAHRVSRVAGLGFLGGAVPLTLAGVF